MFLPPNRISLIIIILYHIYLAWTVPYIKKEKERAVVHSPSRKSTVVVVADPFTFLFFILFLFFASIIDHTTIPHPYVPCLSHKAKSIHSKKIFTKQKTIHYAFVFRFSFVVVCFWLYHTYTSVPFYFPKWLKRESRERERERERGQDQVVQRLKCQQQDYHQQQTFH